MFFHVEARYVRLAHLPRRYQRCNPRHASTQRITRRAEERLGHGDEPARRAHAAGLDMHAERLARYCEEGVLQILRWSVYGQRALSRIEPSEEGRLRLERHLDVRTAGARSLRLDRLDHPRAHLHLRLCTHALFRRRGRLLGSSSRGSPHTSLLARASLKLGFQMLDLLPELVDFILEIGHHLRALGPRLVDRLHRQPLVVPRAKSLLSQRFKRRLERLDDAPASLGHAAPEASVAPTGRHGLARGGLPGQAHIRTQGCGSPVVESGISFRPRPQRLLVPRRRAVPSTAQRQVVSRQGGGGAEGGAGGGAGVRAARGRAVDRMVGEGVARRRANVVEHSKRLERINHLRRRRCIRSGARHVRVLEVVEALLQVLAAGTLACILLNKLQELQRRLAFRYRATQTSLRREHWPHPESTAGTTAYPALARALPPAAGARAAGA
mmetsp:Transcript_18748/g.61306  ORF Transcript_18748/g.61306 Transcript_18748/m.61306 type:complete len:440 (+) Transcript_18748:1705-3024(+)